MNNHSRYFISGGPAVGFINEAVKGLNSCLPLPCFCQVTNIYFILAFFKVKCLKYRRLFIICLFTEPVSDSCENTVLSAGQFGPALPSVDSAVESWDSSVLEQSAPSNNASPECSQPLQQQQLCVAEVYKSGEYESSYCNLFASFSPVVLKSMSILNQHFSV
jgi:hypothetical protein